MEELIFKLWPYIERAGAVSGVIFATLYILKHREVTAAYKRLEDVAAQNVIDGRAAVAVIEKNTAAFQSSSKLAEEQSDLIRHLLMTIIGNKNA